MCVSCACVNRLLNIGSFATNAPYSWATHVHIYHLDISTIYESFMSYLCVIYILYENKRSLRLFHFSVGYVARHYSYSIHAFYYSCNIMFEVTGLFLIAIY